MMKKGLSLCLIICLSLLSACKKNQSIKPISYISNWNQVNWSIHGKMAINNGQNSGSGRFKWQQTAEALNASFKAPLGQGSWNITESTVKPKQAELISSENGTTYAENAEQLISNELGWLFPWSKIKYWLRGINSENQTPTITQSNTPKTIEDSGWNIEIQQWMSTEAGWLPKKIKASKAPYSVKIIIYDWEIK